MRSQDIRERFLQFFEDRGHRRLASASLLAHDDPSILFTVAGMVPFKGYFLGQASPPSLRVTSIQKCFRTVDIEQVGYTPRHDTFFEMLGNFSFGDYFKAEAIEYAWDLLTGDFGLPKERLFPTVHPSDEVALQIWADKIGVAATKITRLEDNFWEAGVGLPGPCGYDSEIFWDRQVDCSCGRADCKPGCDGDRFIEIWNLVFMEFDRDAEGKMNPLPRPSIDTGMGMERTAMVLQDKASIFETDLFVPIINSLSKRVDANMSENEFLVSLRVCAEHLRASTFLIADGLLPANTGAGYVLRRLIRRAALHARRVNLQGHLADDVNEVVALMGNSYPEVAEHQSLVVDILRAEEIAFERTLGQGIEKLEELLTHDVRTISGEDAFKLYDTYGLPIELTKELADQQGITVDGSGFEKAMARQRARSRDVGRQHGFTGTRFVIPPTRFVGYEKLEVDTKVIHVGENEGSTILLAGNEGAVFLESSPFYAESGGQVGDTGWLTWDGGKGAILDTVFIPGTEVRAHQVRVDDGGLKAEMVVEAKVDAVRRVQVARHHSATHLLHKALRQVLGDTLVQRGSYVGPTYTTFDFSFPQALTDSQIKEIEHLVNCAIRDNHERKVDLLPIEQARKTGAVALFGEKYGEEVRVVDFGGWARELCGGTHVNRSGDIGAAIIVSESSIGQGLRRIEMKVGQAAEELWSSDRQILHKTALLLKIPANEIFTRVSGLHEQLRKLQKELTVAKQAQPISDLTQNVDMSEIAGIRLASLQLDINEQDASMIDKVADQLFAEKLQGKGITVVLGRQSLVIKVAKAWVDQGINAGLLAKTASQITGAKGGGRPDFARGGVGDEQKRTQAMEAINQLLIATREAA